MNERIKELRKKLNLNQADFGKMIGVTVTAISKVEKGINNVSDRLILSICKEFNVNEEWLRTGTGTMFNEVSRDDEIAKFFENVQLGSDNFKKRFISMLSSLGENEWRVLEEMALKLVEDKKEDTNNISDLKKQAKQKQTELDEIEAKIEKIQESNSSPEGNENSKMA
ncbi:MAG: helix-turn-helix domain-containing protein [bacterium]|nr:helix-turn-helix domain-containing protein [bacterium]